MSPQKLYDRNGREIGVGDVVHIIGKGDVMWRVQALKPNLNPALPKDLIEYHLVAVFVDGLPGGRPIIDLLKVRDASEQAAVKGANPGEDEQEGTVKLT